MSKCYYRNELLQQVLYNFFKIGIVVETVDKVSQYLMTVGILVLGRERGREGGREGGREEEREGGREGGREEEEREGGREGGRGERGRQGSDYFHYSIDCL